MKNIIFLCLLSFAYAATFKNSKVELVDVGENVDPQYNNYKCVFYKHKYCQIIDNILYNIISLVIVLFSTFLLYIIYSLFIYLCSYNKPHSIKSIFKNI